MRESSIIDYSFPSLFFVFIFFVLSLGVLLQHEIHTTALLKCYSIMQFPYTFSYFTMCSHSSGVLQWIPNRLGWSDWVEEMLFHTIDRPPCQFMHISETSHIYNSLKSMWLYIAMRLNIDVIFLKYVWLFQWFEVIRDV